jgi:SAM-dependent methyltransferase
MPGRVSAVDRRRAARARERQLDYMKSFREEWRGREHQLVTDMRTHAGNIRRIVDGVRPIRPEDRVLEVGSGGCGLSFNFGGDVVGIDPLADDLRKLFPWQRESNVPTMTAEGEHLPFDDASFDIVLSDNVIDHAEDPQRIVDEMARVLKPGGVLYFTVHVHHPFYHLASRIYGAWRKLGLPGEVTPFADHTVHLSPDAAKGLFARLPLRIVTQTIDVAETKRDARTLVPRHMGDRLKRLFYKNATIEVVAIREYGAIPKR